MLLNLVHLSYKIAIQSSYIILNCFITDFMEITEATYRNSKYILTVFRHSQHFIKKELTERLSSTKQPSCIVLNSMTRIKQFLKELPLFARASPISNVIMQQSMKIHC